MVRVTEVKVAKGRASKALTMDQITALRNIQRRERLTITALADYIEFRSVRTLGRALRGSRIWDLDAELIGDWLEEFERVTAGQEKTE